MALPRKPKCTTFDVFVGNLPPDANEKNVGKLFIPYGEISGIVVRESKQTPESKLAFVKFLCEPDADRACSEMNNRDLNGRTIAVRRSENRKKPPGEGGDKGGKARDSPKPALLPAPANPSFQGFKGPDIAEDRKGVGFQMSEPQGEKETAMITHVESANTLWVQIVNDDNTRKIFHITEQLAALCPAARKVTTMPEPNKIYAANFSEDGLWYRCMLRQPLGTERMKIQYVDYGNTEEVAVGSLVDIPQSLAAIKGLSQKVALHNVRPKDLSDKRAVQHLKTITDGQMAQLVKTRQLGDGSGHYAHVFVGGQSLAELMVQEGFCSKRPMMSGKNQPPSQQHSGGGDAPAGGGFSSAVPDRPGYPSPLMQDRSELGPCNVQVSLNQQESKELRSELTKKKRELERVRNEKDAQRMELEYVKNKMKNMQDEYAALACKLAENTLSERIKSVINLASKVRILRQQFPTNRSCCLEDAIALCQSGDKVDNSSVTTLAAVGSSVSTYKAAQTEISNCKEQSELGDVIKSRDAARLVLYEKLEACVNELNGMPLEKRCEEVKVMEEQLSSTYPQFLKFVIHECPSMENIVPGFKTWKTKKDGEFADVRTATNYSESAVQKVLQHLQTLFTVDEPNQMTKSDIDMDGLMKTYAHALQREITVTDLEHSKDASLVATVVASVRRELQAEHSTLENLQYLLKDFTSMKQSIEPWLKEKPSLYDMQESRKSLRSLKSKLRHKMADKQDIEEGEGSEGELDRVKMEVEDIRTELQTALQHAEEVVCEVARLADGHFPELIIQYLDLGIEMQLAFRGLVKTYREIDHYSLTPAFRPGVYQSMFVHQRVMIQEYHIGDSEHCSKDEFMKQILSYNGETKPIHAVFFSKNDRQAYTESNWIDGELLESLVKKKTLETKEIQQVAKCVIETLADLNARGLVHGEVTPQSILIQEGTTALLLPFDFSKTLVDRVNKKYTTESGLVFQVPDFLGSSPEGIGPNVDLYNLALIILWMHFPNERIPVRPNGVPEIRGLNLDLPLRMLLDTLLQMNPGMVMPAGQLLIMDYFTQTFPDQNRQTMPQPLLTPTPPPTMMSSPPPSLIATPPAVSPKPVQVGVFQEEPVVLKEVVKEEVIEPIEGDTDSSSWTTQTNSSSGSRVDSPQDEAVAAQVKAEVVDTVTEEQFMVAEAEIVSHDEPEEEADTMTNIGVWSNDCANLPGQMNDVSFVKSDLAYGDGGTDSNSGNGWPVDGTERLQEAISLTGSSSGLVGGVDLSSGISIEASLQAALEGQMASLALQEENENVDSSPESQSNGNVEEAKEACATSDQSETSKPEAEEDKAALSFDS